MVIHHEQSSIIIYDSAGRERNNFQQLPKLIELKFISTTGPRYLTRASKVTQQQLSKHLSKCLVNVKFYINLAPCSS